MNTQKSMTKSTKPFWFLSFGIILYFADCLLIPAVYFPSSGGRGYTLGAMLFIFFMWPPILAAIILGLPCLVIGLAWDRYTKCFLVFAILFFAAGLVEAGGTAMDRFILEPKLRQQINELVSEGILDIPDHDPREKLLGHWASEDSITHFYFSSHNLIIVNFGQEKEVTYEILESNSKEQWVKFNVSGADYVRHTRTMYFLGDGIAWQVTESSLGNWKSKFKRVGPEESP